MHRCRQWAWPQNYVDFSSTMTVILRRWIVINRQYQEYFAVGKSASTVDINRDQLNRSINQWIGVDIWIGVGTISHHTWNHDFLVDVCPGPFLTTYGTIGQWSFFSTSRKNAVNQFCFGMNPHHRSISTNFSWNWRSMWHQPYFQLGESVSTVDINRILI